MEKKKNNSIEQKSCGYCGRIGVTYPVSDNRSGVPVESDYCAECLWELMASGEEEEI